MGFWAKIPNLCALIFFASVSVSLAQSNNYKAGEKTKLKSEHQVYGTYLYAFPNINKIPYYIDESALTQIEKLNKQKDWEKLYPLLKGYVQKFGTENFYKDTFWLWRLAKLTELYGSLDEAKALYRLILKHHRANIDIKKIELYYDSLDRDAAKYYVPLDYYYELVEYRKSVDTLRPPRGVLLNMGKTVNSEYEDYGPTFNVNNDKLIFTSKRNIIRKGFEEIKNEDLFYSERKDNEYWLDAKALSEINTIFNEGSACLSKNGKTLYFARCDAPDGYGNCDIYVAQLLGDSTWGNVQNLGPNINTTSWDSQPTLSHSEDTIYFASDRIGGFGLSDIYFSYKTKDGWVPAQNVGPVINTRNNDVSPFIHPAHNILYFTSNGHILNFGDYDIYKSYKKNNLWGEPLNIGPLVNGSGSEFYFTIDSNSEELFYAKSTEQSIQNLDIYSFPLPMEAQPDAVTRLSGSLTNATGDPFQGIVSVIDLDKGVEVAPKFLREDGTFDFYLINNRNYLLIIQGDDFFRIEEIFYLDGETDLNLVTEAISSKMKFESIVFDNGSAELKAEMYDDLGKVLDFLLDHPSFKLKISGHTDSDGNADYNQKLSQNRAESIMDYLVNIGGVNVMRIEAKGYGSTKPIVVEKTEKDKKLNRRVEFEIYRPSKEELNRDFKQQHKEEQQESEGWD